MSSAIPERRARAQRRRWASFAGGARVEASESYSSRATPEHEAASYGAGAGPDGSGFVPDPPRDRGRKAHDRPPTAIAPRRRTAPRQAGPATRRAAKAGAWSWAVIEAA